MNGRLNSVVLCGLCLVKRASLEMAQQGLEEGLALIGMWVLTGAARNSDSVKPGVVEERIVLVGTWDLFGSVMRNGMVPRVVAEVAIKGDLKVEFELKGL